MRNKLTYMCGVKKKGTIDNSAICNCFHLMFCFLKSTWYICCVKSKIDHSSYDTPCCGVPVCIQKYATSQSSSFSTRLHVNLSCFKESV